MYQELVADNKKVMVNLYLIYFSSFTIPLINGLNQSIPLNLDTNELIFGQVSICISLFVLYLYQIYSTPFIEFEKIQYRVLNKKFEKSDLSNYSLAYVLFKKSTIKRVWESLSPAGGQNWRRFGRFLQNTFTRGPAQPQRPPNPVNINITNTTAENSAEATKISRETGLMGLGGALGGGAIIGGVSYVNNQDNLEMAQKKLDLEKDKLDWEKEKEKEELALEKRKLALDEEKLALERKKLERLDRQNSDEGFKISQKQNRGCGIL
jgi:hypothetical protein